ncbi:hypothetical protein IEN31_004382 [Salmonella enterica subsp. enterica serovar Typhi]|uniref:Uncharacterized protein n=1 Tax=Salmonella enterica subsp. enterica serovar Typhi str. CT18 TaxID=220341 RepID=A0A717FJZ9_SALTI|nr:MULTISPECIES: hypothetical protein [Enterobacteriaceae]EAM4869545.1 hypothetical protein [Salmonella enterica]EBW6739092.1 hypothetical protein [Salmonella enterica subsp. enterica serovar Oranienburg]ECI2455144.1 hypothetical protein [Salmonella enterica subsp. enterica serovar Coleypark]ECO1424749.1 hypothetical protein [Salmonella enterica subsp. enterica serovar Senftenberg]EEJ2630896.1 hypothetical protein [Salmonella enterica subsp. enterica serovar Anatum]EEL4020704.1 hypothetical p
MNSIKEIKTIALAHGILNDIRKGRNHNEVFASSERIDVDYLTKYLSGKLGKKITTFKKLDGILSYSKRKDQIVSGSVFFYAPEKNQDSEKEAQFLKLLTFKLAQNNSFFIHFQDQREGGL